MTGTFAHHPSLPKPEQKPDFEELYAEYFPFVWRCLRSLGVPTSILDDAAQDVFATVHRRMSDFRHESSIKTWLYGIVRRVAANQRRRIDRKGTHSELDPNQPSVVPGPLELAQDREAAEFIQRFLSELDEKKREIFILVGLEEMPIAEVARALGVPLNTTYTRWRTARLAFQHALARHGGFHVPA